MAQLRILIITGLTLLMAQSAHAQREVVRSPNDVLAVVFELRDGVPYYAVERFGRMIVNPSRLGFAFENMPSLDGGFEVAATSRNSVDDTWQQVWGEKEYIRDHHNELRVDLVESAAPGRTMTLVFRVFDDGVGFRYEIPEQPGVEEIIISDELTEFAFADDYESWYIDAYRWNRYEYLTRHTPLSEADTVHTPLTMRSQDGLHISVHQAALVDYSTMALENMDGTRFKANLVPWSDGILVRTRAPMKTPWRTIQIADDAGGLIESYLILNLNEPNRIDDTSWIEPARYVGIWWEMHLEKATWESGEMHGATTENALRYIDFAAEHGFDHVLVEGWNVGWDGSWYDNSEVFSFTEPYPDFDLDRMAAYALEQGVRLMGHHETSAGVEHYERQIEDAFRLYEGLGIRSVKTGYVGHGQSIVRTDEDGRRHREWHHGQFLVEHHQRVVELAARHQISLNVHEGVIDTGLRRTWPNLMTREVARGQEYNAWGEGDPGIWEGRPGNPPDHVVTIPFTRMLAGPFDYTPGIVDLLFDDYRPGNRVNHTLAKELSLYLILYSPLQMAADLPESYERFPVPLRFIKDVPVDWADTWVLNADIGNYLTIARKDRHSDDWYLGSATDEHGRHLRVPLSFLDSGRVYVAEIYRDSDDADWETNPYGLIYEERTVDSSKVLDLRLAPGGGQAVRFRVAE